VSRPAVFLDRDGTIIRDHHFIGKPEMVELLPGVGAAIKRLNDAGWPVIVVTNQSGIARGRFTTVDFERVKARTRELLAQSGAHVKDCYMCPHHPDFTGPCDCRKPGTLLFLRAATEHDLSLSGSWCIGDKARDVTPALALDCRGILVPNEKTPQSEINEIRKDFGADGIATTLDEAVDRVIESAR
jgi:D-glycero-D-manno-heptose 1,7-bisphosphate phosphatase